MLAPFLFFEGNRLRQPDFHLKVGRQNGFHTENRRKPPSAACGTAVRQAEPRVLPLAVTAVRACGAVAKRVPQRSRERIPTPSGDGMPERFRTAVG